MKKSKRIIQILVIVILILGFIYANPLIAKADDTYTTDSITITTKPDSGENGGGLTNMTDDEALDNYKPSGVTGANELRRRSNMLVTALQAIGSVVAVIMLSVIAIKYMLASVEEKADYKQTMIPYIIGAGSLLIVSNLVGIIYSLVQGINV